jgi:hypothetical protein
VSSSLQSWFSLHKGSDSIPDGAELFAAVKYAYSSFKLIAVSKVRTVNGHCSIGCINISQFGQDYKYQRVIKYALLSFLSISLLSN